MSTQSPRLDLASSLILSSTGGMKLSSSTLISSIFFFNLRDGLLGDWSLSTTVTDPLLDLG